MKRARSDLIEDFLSNVRHEIIVGKERSSGPATLRRMAAALQDFLIGTKTFDEAFEVTRGPDRDPEWDYISRVVHNNLKLKVKAASIESMVNEYLERIGRDPVSWQAIKKNHGLRQTELDEQDSHHAMIKFIRDHK